ncbi:MAG: hypothetical protein JWQ02_4274 [Capsulimonas sp.]|nr:hypothetical protein [Capsulimonas sp.]
MTLINTPRIKSTRLISLALIATLAFPTLAMTAGCGSKTDTAPPPSSSGPMMSTTPTAQQRPGMSTKQKVVLLAGAALLYYLYKKHQASQNQTTPGASPQGQLYQSKNGGIYYRNAQHKPVWVTAPSGGVQVPADQVQRYAPDYGRFQNVPAPAPPAGEPTASALDFDSSLAAPGPRGPGM